MTLTEAQRRALRIGLAHIENDLAWIETLLRWTYEGVMTTFEEDVGDSAQRELRERIAEARELIGRMARTFGLEREVISKSRWIGAHLVQLWVVTEECQSRYLRAYGEVTPDLAAVVDPAARPLGELLLSMQRIARGAPIGASVSGDDARRSGRL